MFRRKQQPSVQQAPVNTGGNGINPIFLIILAVYGLSFLGHGVTGNIDMRNFFQNAESEINKLAK